MKKFLKLITVVQLAYKGYSWFKKRNKTQNSEVNNTKTPIKTESPINTGSPINS